MMYFGCASGLPVTFVQIDHVECKVQFLVGTSYGQDTLLCSLGECQDGQDREIKNVYR